MLQRTGGYGRAIVTTGEVQISQCAGLVSSPSAFSTDTLTMYWPLGTRYCWLSFLPLPVKVMPSQVKAKKPPVCATCHVLVEADRGAMHDPVLASNASSRILRDM